MASYLDLLVDQQISAAMARGEFDDLPGAGRPIADLDRQRQPGWFAENLVRRERSRVLQADTVEELSRRRVAFWRAATIDELRGLVLEANRLIAATNPRLEPDDRLDLVDLRATAQTWRSVHRA